MTEAVAEAWGKPLPMNVSMAIAATMRDLDVPAALIRGIPILARTAGLIAHLGEEAETPIGFFLAARPRRRSNIPPSPEARASRMSLIEPEIESAPWEGASRGGRRRSIASRSTICSSARASIRTSSAGRASRSPTTVGGLDDIAELPLTEKDELRQSRSARRADR